MYEFVYVVYCFVQSMGTSDHCPDDTELTELNSCWLLLLLLPGHHPP
jgi:hypothetical protein